ncbi:DUF2927 domain-containing protein [Carboxylicivirga marina]|uniref:DUF2927 domain-containing protein n=1 Tax=Carboxylicivirga marina TaxID=2800988 RepID=A0ABS1HP17_9BACT|nr:DUF2927 domain-containing protein [Carboxylicivirga marina]MBK3519444.1 DUF2927 domain-containing protein [Carboxylicivirga marina]
MSKVKVIGKSEFPEEVTKHAVRELFITTAFNPEFGQQNKKIKKWGENLRVYIKNTEHVELIAEFERVSTEINALSSDITIERVVDEQQANFIIFLSSHHEYAKYRPNVKQYLDGNWGFFWTNRNRNSEIVKGNMHVDVIRCEDINCQKHLLREELTQALGMMNDSRKHKNSIFYSQWTCQPSYCELDKEVIKLFLSSEIKAGMNLSEVKQVLEWD